MTAKTSAQVLKLNGLDQYVQLGAAEALSLINADFTVEAWIKIQGFTGADLTILGADERAAESACIHLTIRDRRPYMGFYKNDTAGTTVLEAGVWYHVAWRYTRATGEQALFVNGVLDASSVGHAPYVGTGTVHLGRWAAGARSLGEVTYFNGLIAEVRVWARAMPQPEISANLYDRLSGCERYLTAYWPLNDGSGVQARDARWPIDKGGAALVADARRVHGAVIGAEWAASETPFSAGVRRALSFDGVVSSAVVPDLNGFPDASLTLECWARSSDDAPDATILGYAPPGAGAALIVANPADLRLSIGGDSVSTGVSMNDGDWHHLAITWSRVDGAVTLYRDGHSAFAGALSMGSVISAGGRLVLGREVVPLGADAPTGKAFAGEINDVRLWRVVRTASEIDSNKFIRLVGNESGLVGAWALDQSVGRAFPDSAGMCHGLISGARWVTPEVAAEAITAIEFDGIDDYISISSVAGDSLAISDAICVEAWVMPVGAAGSLAMSPVASKHGALKGWELRAAAGACSFLVAVDGGVQEIIAPDVEPNRWHHLAGVYDGKALSIYVNGVLKGTRAASGPISVYPVDVNLGRNSYWRDRVFAGQIAEVRIWSRARAQADVQRAMFGRLTGAEAGLAAYFRLGEGSGNRTFDLSPNANHGVIGGASWVSSNAPLPPADGAVVGVAQLDVQSMKRELNERLQDIKTLKNKLEIANTAAASLMRDLSAQASANTALKNEILALRRRLADAAKLEAQVADRDAQIQQLEARIADWATAGGSETTLNNFVRQSNEEILKARDALKQRGSDYSLGRVTLELKMLPGPGGVGMSFPKVHDMQKLEAAHLSTLNLDFVPRESHAVAAAQLVLTPSVLGYTEIMARRKLAEGGFGVEVSYQAVSTAADAPVKVDRVVSQYPEPGTDAKPASVVTIFIGRAS